MWHNCVQLFVGWGVQLGAQVEVRLCGFALWSAMSISHSLIPALESNVDITMTCGTTVISELPPWAIALDHKSGMHLAPNPGLIGAAPRNHFRTPACISKPMPGIFETSPPTASNNKINVEPTRDFLGTSPAITSMLKRPTAPATTPKSILQSSDFDDI